MHDEVVASLREMIVTGALQPGDRIIEHDLSAQLGVSRTPIREAIKTLTLDGLVESPAHRGAMVKPLDAAEIETLFQVIAVLEALAAEQAATCLSPQQTRKLENLHSRMKKAFDQGDRSRYFELNSEIHDFLVEHSGNPILRDTHERLMLRARRGRYLAILSGTRWAEAMQQHEDLMIALRQGDSELAARIWRAHLQMTGEALLQSLKESPT
nr:GntR family transcriptional regulator [Paracoccus methylarcula]